MAIKKKTALIWQNFVTMLIQLESTETYISSLEICKENTIKEINGLKYPIKLFQKKKLKN